MLGNTESLRGINPQTPMSNRLREHCVPFRGHTSKLKVSGFDGHSLPFLGKGVGYSSMIPVTFFLFFAND